MQDVGNYIREVWREVAREADRPLREPLRSDLSLTESGLDSLGIAIVVSLLEERLELDPFAALEGDFPQTFGEFIALYTDAANGRD